MTLLLHKVNHIPIKALCFRGVYDFFMMKLTYGIAINLTIQVL